jgi:hypothetical protein
MEDPSHHIEGFVRLNDLPEGLKRILRRWADWDHLLEQERLHGVEWARKVAEAAWAEFDKKIKGEQRELLAFIRTLEDISKGAKTFKHWPPKK